MPQDIDDIIKSLDEKLANKKFEPFISHIRFPFFKNLERDTKIEFQFPITAIVGQNGTNKSTILRALYGSPGNNSIGTYWFSTKLDSIKSSKEDRPCFIYQYWNADAARDVEVLKTRIEKKSSTGDTDPDYWEPSRPLRKYDMEPMPPLPEGTENAPGRSGSRWNTIDKEVLYLDFRTEISAHDKYFHHADYSGTSSSLKIRKDFIRARSNPLRHAIKNGKSIYEFYKKNRILSSTNRKLNPNELKAISSILDRDYSEIHIIKHNFFRIIGTSILLVTKNLDYSEAFAGSGEFSVVRLVTEILSAKHNSLVLLDEPEISLHPGAQKNLMRFLLTETVKKNFQVVISTHSPTLIEDLPDKAIKVLAINPVGTVSLTKQNSIPREAFYYLGDFSKSKKRIIVEDELSMHFINHILSTENSLLSQVEIIPFGGADWLRTKYFPILSSEGETETLAILDGDQEPTFEFPDRRMISGGTQQDLDKFIESYCGTRHISLFLIGGDTERSAMQRIEQLKKYILWIYDYVTYLPGNRSPEEFIWDNLISEDKVVQEIKGLSNTPKEKFVHLAHRKLYPGRKGITPISKEILQYQREMLASIPPDIEPLVKLRERIRKFLA